MNQSYAIDVIIPIYNVEIYLKKCLESVKNQTFTSFRVIMINDGSSDKSGDIAKEYADTCHNFEYHTIPNGGPANARNYGITFSSSKYIAFVDSDDTVAPDYLEKLFYAAEDSQADVVFCNHNLYYENANMLLKVKIRKLKKGVYAPDQIVKMLIHDFYARSYPWNKLWKRSLFTDNNVTFPKMFFEDIPTVLTLCNQANKIVSIDDALYNYTKRSNSIISSFFTEKLNDYTKTLGAAISILRTSHHTLKNYRLAIYHFAFLIFCVNVYSVIHIHFEKRLIQGLWRNLTAAVCGIFYFLSAKFMLPNEPVPDLPYIIKEPEYYKNKTENSQSLRKRFVKKFTKH